MAISVSSPPDIRGDVSRKWLRHGGTARPGAGMAVAIIIGHAAIAMYALMAAAQLYRACGGFIGACQFDLAGIAATSIVGVAGFGLARGCRSFARQVRETRACQDLLPYLAVPGALHATVERQYDPELHVIEHARPLAMTLGFLRPVVVVATGTLRVTSAEQLGAILAHEAEHAKNRDPLRHAIVRAATAMLWWAPAVRTWPQQVRLRSERVADAAAIQVTSKRALVGALTSILDGPTQERAANERSDTRRSAALSLIEQRLQVLSKSGHGTVPPKASSDIALTAAACPDTGPATSSLS